MTVIFSQDMSETDLRGVGFHSPQMDEPGAGAAEIPFEILCNHLEHYCFSKPSLITFQRCEDVSELRFRAQRMFYVRQLSVWESVETIGRMKEAVRSCVRDLGSKLDEVGVSKKGISRNLKHITIATRVAAD
jgi:hypothetical protein